MSSSDILDQLECRLSTERHFPQNHEINNTVAKNSVSAKVWYRMVRSNYFHKQNVYK